MTITTVPTSALHHDHQAPVLTLSCTQEELARGLAIVSNAVLSDSTMPILKHILLTTERGRLRLSATTLDIGIQVWINARIEQGTGTTALPAELLRRIVGTLPTGDLRLSLEAGSHIVTLTSPGSTTTLRGVDPAEFPLIPGIEPGQTPAIIDASVLKNMLDQVVFIAEKDVFGQPILASIKLSIAEGRLTLAAAETVRVAERIEPLTPTSGTHPVDVLIPARNLAKLASILPIQGQVHLLVTPRKNQIIFHLEQGEQIDVVSRLIDGVFPPYQRLLPTAHTTRVIADRKALMSAVAGASLFAVDRTRSVQITCTPAGEGSPTGLLTIKAEHADLGSSVSRILAAITGPAQELFFPVEKLEQALDHLETPTIALEIIASGRPVVFKPVGDLQYLSLLQTMARTTC